jgi:hypothetical protein
MVLLAVVAGIAIGVPALLYVIHVTLMPMGTMITAVAELVGLGGFVDFFEPGISG